MQLKSGVIYSECTSVALVIQHAMRMRRIILSSASCPAVSYFSTFYDKRQNFQKNVFEQNLCFVFLYDFCLLTFHFRGRMYPALLLRLLREYRVDGDDNEDMTWCSNSLSLTAIRPLNAAQNTHFCRPPARAYTHTDCSLATECFRRTLVYKAFFVCYVNRA
jgi:hypothetical protein